LCWGKGRILSRAEFAPPTTPRGISKRGDVYLRTLLIHGARSAILAARRRNDNRNGW